MRHWLFLVILLAALVPGAAFAQKRVDIGYVPPGNEDIAAVLVALGKVPADGLCTPTLCPSFSCPAMGELAARLDETGLVVSALRAALTEALVDYRRQLDAFDAAYAEHIRDDEQVGLAQRWSKFFLAFGRNTLAIASIMSGAEAIGDLSGEIPNAVLSDKLVAGLLILDRLTELIGNMIGFVDEARQGMGGKPLFADITNKTILGKGALSDILNAAKSLGDAMKVMAEAIEKGDEAAQAVARRDLLTLAKSRASIGQLVGKALGVIADMQLEKLADRLAENAEYEAAINEAFAKSYGDYIALADRSVLIVNLARQLSAIRTSLSGCAALCSQTVTTKIEPVDRGTSYGDTLRINDQRLAGLAATLAKAAAALEFKPGAPVLLSVNPGKVAPSDKTVVSYSIPQCLATEGSKLELREPAPGSDWKPILSSAAILGEPAAKDLAAPDTKGSYEIWIVDAAAKPLARTPLTVEEPPVPDVAQYCGLEFRKGMYSSNWRERDHLAPKTMPFAFGDPEDADYLKGTLVIRPGIACFADRLTFPLFAGVSREAEFFTVTMQKGDASRVTYLEQWFSELRVQFDTPGVLSSYDSLAGVAIPANAKAVQWVQMTFERGGNKRTFTWTR